MEPFLLAESPNFANVGSSSGYHFLATTIKIVYNFNNYKYL
jgi:hypothetical protein